MRKLLLFPLLILLVSFAPSPKVVKGLAPSLVDGDRLNATLLYQSLQLKEKGLSKQAFEYAYIGYRYMVQRNLLANQDYLTICDLSQSSKRKRLYVIDISNKQVLLNTYVAHGQNSGREFATRFSNRPSSLQSSLGFYITGNTYNGEHGLSLRVKGLEKGFNDRAILRGIVIHGANYIGDNGTNRGVFMGRSFGCPAVPKAVSTELINIIKEGSCLFIYHPSKYYLKKSRILNA